MHIIMRQPSPSAGSTTCHFPFDFRDSAPAPGQKSQVLVLDLGHGGRKPPLPLLESHDSVCGN